MMTRALQEVIYMALPEQSGVESGHSSVEKDLVNGGCIGV
jgi:hypothetical protein